MADIDLQRLYAVFETVEDLRLKKELYSAAGNTAKASELEKKLFFGELKNKKIETVDDYVSILNEADLLGISSKELLGSFIAQINIELGCYSGLGSEYNPPAEAYLHRQQALFHEARFGVHYLEEDLQKALALRQKGIEELLRCEKYELRLEIEETLAMFAKDSISESTRNVCLESEKSIDSLLAYSACINRILKEKEEREDFVRQNVEILLYLNKTASSKPEAKQKISQARIGFLEALTEKAVHTAESIYSKIEKEDKNGFIVWCFKCTCTYVQRAINFAERLSCTGDEKVTVSKARLNESFAKLEEVYKHRKYAAEDFNLWIGKLVKTENPVPDHKNSTWHIPEDDLMFPRKITLTAEF